MSSKGLRNIYSHVRSDADYHTVGEYRLFFLVAVSRIGIEGSMDRQ